MNLAMNATKWKKQGVCIALLIAVLASAVAKAQDTAATALPDYSTVAGISGKLSIDSGNVPENLAAMWLDRFSAYYPDVSVELDNSGFSAASNALIDTSQTLALMGRPMSDTELAAFEAKYGYRPMGIKVAHGAVVIYVSDTNPISQINLAQLDAVFSRNLSCGETQAISSWRQLGVKDKQTQDQINLVGLELGSSESEILRQRALCDGDFRVDMQQLTSAAAVQAVVATDGAALGFADLGSGMTGVKGLSIGRTAKGPFIAASADNIRRGSYPLAHDFYIYVNRPPDGSMPPLEHEFIRMLLSDVGQRVVTEMGYLSLSPGEIQQQLALLK